MSTSSIVLGGGCFWCLEAVFQRIPGVTAVTPGYAGGRSDAPTYEQVCTGTTGHAEVVRIEYDNAKISLRQLLDFFFAAHDPTTLNYQGADVGTQYRSIVFYSDEPEHRIIDEARLAAQVDLSDPIVTEVAQLRKFYSAETYHHDYFNRNRESGYCRAVITPKLKKLDLMP